MVQGEHLTILLTFIKLPVIKTFLLSIFEWPFYNRFYCTVKTMIIERNLVYEKGMLMLKLHFQGDLGSKWVKYARLTIINVCFTSLMLAGSLG